MLENLCIGIDVGGTFTDAVLTGAGEVIRAKALTTHGDPGRGVIAACELVAERLGVALDDLLPNVKRFGLGTTVVTNQIASRAGRRIGLITTAGFENIVPFSKLHWGSENGWLVSPPQIISRDRIIGVAERIDRRGEVITPLDETAVLAAATTLVESREVEALAVSFIWSVRNDSHEARAVRLIRERYPDLPVSSAVSLLPVVREYERTMFCLLNSYTSGALAGIDWLSEELARRGLSAPLLLIHSGGGATSVEEARQVPVSLAESGPAAGVGAAAMLAASCGVSALSFMECLPIPPRVLETGSNRRDRPRSAARLLCAAAPLTKVTELACSALPKAPNIGRKYCGWGVGIEAFGSPMTAAAMVPHFRIMSGFTPKKAGVHTTRSASLPTSTEPT